MSSRNWMMRRMLTESIRQDPAYDNSHYMAQPPSLRLANVFMGIGTSGGTLAYQALAPTREKADKLVDKRLAQPAPIDANDFVYQWEASRDYNPAPALESIVAPVLAINAADDERNPPETGVIAAALGRVKNATCCCFPRARKLEAMAPRGWRSSGSSNWRISSSRCPDTRCRAAAGFASSSIETRPALTRSTKMWGWIADFPTGKTDTGAPLDIPRSRGQACAASSGSTRDHAFWTIRRRSGATWRRT
jgi:hypothetical protein